MSLFFNFDYTNTSVLPPREREQYVRDYRSSIYHLSGNLLLTLSVCVCVSDLLFLSLYVCVNGRTTHVCVSQSLCVCLSDSHSLSPSPLSGSLFLSLILSLCSSLHVCLSFFFPTPHHSTWKRSQASLSPYLFASNSYLD